MEFDDEALQALLDADPRQTTRELAEQLNCSHTTVERHLHALGKVHKWGCLVPHQLSTDNLVQRASICASLLLRQKNKPFSERIITGDEKWVWLNEVLFQKRPALANQKGVILLHDNGKPHVSKLTQQKIEQLGWEVLSHPSWSPDLAPSNYHLFRYLRHHLCNKHYEDSDEIKADLTDFFELQSASFYKRGIELLPARWAKVVENNGDYIFD